MISSDRRSATRITVHLPATVEVLWEPPMGRSFDPGYEWASVPRDAEREPFEATIRNLSLGGAEVVANAVPLLLSRLALRFALPGYGLALAVVKVMWRRTAGVTEQDGRIVPAGFGVRFETVDFEVRSFIADLAERANLGR